MTAKEKKQLKEIEWLMAIGTPDTEIAKKCKVSYRGFALRYKALRKKLLREEYKG